MTEEVALGIQAGCWLICLYIVLKLIFTKPIDPITNRNFDDEMEE